MKRFGLLALMLLGVLSCKPAQPVSELRDNGGGDQCASFQGKKASDCGCNLQCMGCASAEAQKQQFSCVQEIGEAAIPGLKAVSGAIEAIAAVRDLIGDEELRTTLAYFESFDDNGEPSGFEELPADPNQTAEQQPSPPSPPAQDSGDEGGANLLLTEPDLDQLQDIAEQMVEDRLDKEIDKLEKKIYKKGDELVNKAGDRILAKVGVNGCTKKGRVAFKAVSRMISTIEGSQGDVYEQGKTIAEAVQKAAPNLKSALGCLAPKLKKKLEKGGKKVRARVMRVIDPIIKKLGLQKLVGLNLATEKVQAALSCSKKIFDGASVLAQNVGCLMDDLATIREQNRTIETRVGGLHKAPLGAIRKEIKHDLCYADPIRQNDFLMRRYGSFLFDQHAKNLRRGTITGSTSNRADFCGAQCGFDGGDANWCTRFADSMKSNPETAQGWVPLCNSFCGVRQLSRNLYETCASFCCGVDRDCAAESAQVSGSGRSPPGGFKQVESVLPMGVEFRRGDFMATPDYQYLLFMQHDGNLVQYDKEFKVLWASDTAGTNADQAIVQGDGNFVVYRSGTALWSSGSAGKARDRPCELKLQTDSNFVVYCGGESVWSAAHDAKRR